MRVLIVEDDLDFRRSLADLLSKEGFSVEAVGDGLSALQRLKAVDVLVTDIGVAGIDGLKLCSQAIGRNPALAVIVMTGCDSTRSRAEAKYRGAAAYLTKPFGSEELLTHLRRVEAHPAETCEERLTVAGTGGPS